MADEPEYQSTQRLFESLIDGDADPKGRIPTDTGYAGGEKPKGDKPSVDEEPEKHGWGDDNEPDEDDEDDEGYDGEDTDETDETDEDDESDEDDALDSDEEDESEEDANEDDDETDDETETPSYTVKVDGEDVTVTLDEALAGYQRHAAFTRKTQALAEERRGFEATKQETTELRGRYVQGLELVETLLANGEQETDWDELRKKSPTEFATRWADHQRYLENVKAVAEELDSARNAGKTQSDKDFQAHLASEKDKLLAELPEWGTEASRDERIRVATYAKERFGWDDEALSRVPDHRFLLMLRDSMLYRDLLENTKDKKAKAKSKAKTVLKPGPKSPKSARDKKTNAAKLKAKRNREKLRKSGHADDAVPVFLDFLDSEE